jgi:hypothetical protein
MLEFFRVLMFLFPLPSGPNQGNLNLDNRLPGQKTPTSSANSHMNNFPIPSSPHTPGGSMQGSKL